MPRSSKRPSDTVWAEVRYCVRGAVGTRTRYDKMTRAEAENLATCRSIHESDPTPPPEPDEPYMPTSKRSRMVWHKDPDLKRLMHHEKTGELLPRDIQTFDMPESNLQTGQNESLRILKSASDKEKREIIAAAYRRAGKDVCASDITLMNS